jgi:drug/metabolite transporter (DMT)-like permease
MMIPFYIILALVISFLWGMQPVLHKYLLNKINGSTIMLLSSFIYFIAVFITFFLTKNQSIVIKDFKKMNGKDLTVIICTSLFTIFFTNVIYFYILKDHESSIISALIYSSPVFTLIVSYLFLSEKLEAIGVIGILLVLAGVICISLNNNTQRLLGYYQGSD